MHEYQSLAVIAGFAFVYSVIATRLERTPVSGALVFIGFGLVCGPAGLGIIDLGLDGEGLRTLAEVTLALVLYTDSANANLRVLSRYEALPMRLLLVGLPLTIALGVAAGALLFGQLEVFEIALLGTMLAPTDAALGKAVVTNRAVPASVRESLNVESGLNDGVCVPVLFLFLACAAGEAGGTETLRLMVRLPLDEIGIGALTGLALALAGAATMRFCARHDSLTGPWQQTSLAALSLVTFAVAQGLGGSGFIACFVGGLLFGKLAKQHKALLLEGAEGTGNALALVTWVAFGAAVVGDAFSHLTWQVLAYAVLSLTVVRMLPVYLCLAGTGLPANTKLFMGWFGPRGLASIVFVVMASGRGLPGQNTLAATVAWTVILSVVAHGLTANPLATRFGAQAKQLPEHARGT